MLKGFGATLIAQGGLWRRKGSLSKANFPGQHIRALCQDDPKKSFPKFKEANTIVEHLMFLIARLYILVKYMIDLGFLCFMLHVH